MLTTALVIEGLKNIYQAAMLALFVPACSKLAKFLTVAAVFSSIPFLIFLYSSVSGLGLPACFKAFLRSAGFTALAAEALTAISKVLIQASNTLLITTVFNIRLFFRISLVSNSLSLALDTPRKYAIIPPSIK